MQTDIAQLLTNIKLNIAAVEQGERHTAILNEIEADCIQLLELMKLFLISERDSYYGYFLMNLTYDVDFSSRSIAGILLNSVFVAAEFTAGVSYKPAALVQIHAKRNPVYRLP